MNQPYGQRMHPEIRRSVRENIRQYRMAVMGVSDNPSFSYTIGLANKFGFEILVVGLDPRTAQAILNIIHRELHSGMELILDRPYQGDAQSWANLPSMFKRVDHNPLVWEKYCVQAEAWWNKQVPIYQMVYADRKGLLPVDPGYEHAYMGPRQPLLYTHLLHA